MASPRSVRFDPSTEGHLADFVIRHPGLTHSSAAALLVEEGLRMDAHPGVLFREGPAGRRAVVAGGPDVWEAIRAVRLTRASEPALDAVELIDVVADLTGVSPRHLEIAIAYYSDYPAEIDDQLAAADTAEHDAMLAVERRRELLGR